MPGAQLTHILIIVVAPRAWTEKMERDEVSLGERGRGIEGVWLFPDAVVANYGAQMEGH